MSLLDDLNAGGLPGATAFVRLRAKPMPDRINPKDTVRDWSAPDEFRFTGALASSTSVRLPDGLREETESVAYLTVADPTADVRLGDRIRPDPDDGRLWEVNGIPSRDVNAFTGWQPTLQIPLTEWKG